jgi:hypothetical protein
LKESKFEKVLGETYKEFAENKKKKKYEIMKSIHKYRDEKWKKTEICKEGWFVSHRKEIDQETMRKIIQYEEKLNKLNRGEYHWLQRDQISYI